MFLCQKLASLSFNISQDPIEILGVRGKLPANYPAKLGTTNCMLSIVSEKNANVPLLILLVL